MNSRRLLPIAAMVVGVSVSVSYPDASQVESVAETWKVIAWNDLGMHCMDDDYSVFSILPPFNTLQAQVIDTQGKLAKSDAGLRVTYEAVLDPQGSMNSSSRGKTNFWDHAKSLYNGSAVPDTGLAGHDMPGAGNTPQTMAFDAAAHLFTAEGIPLTPFDDGKRKRYYPMMRVVVWQGSNPVAHTDVVLPVSDEMDCTACHSSGSVAEARPAAGWVHDPNFTRDYRLNILRLHDEAQRQNPTYQSALTTAGYDSRGLFATVTQVGKPILCAACHKSNALPGTGIQGIGSLTAAMHTGHAQVKDPETGKTLGSVTNRSSCYRCHPGSDTRCLRGAMGGAVARDGSLSMSCQECHGQMSDVGDPGREGWLDQPGCQACHTGTATHNNGQIRYASALDAAGKLRQAVDATFATNPNVPSPGFSLYRFSKGHGGLRCEACHGSTHAVYPSIHGNDNVQSTALQGHVGTLVRCDACHKETPEVELDGPHGMHPVGEDWVDWHGDAAENLGLASCQACHGTDYRGTVLSLSHSDQVLRSKFGNKPLFRGARVTCYACHNGPRSEQNNPNIAPVARDAAATTSTQPVQIPLTATDADQNPLTLRIISQPKAGRVALVGTTATYYPDPGFAGEDRFTFAAFDGAIDSNLATVRVTRRATSRNYGSGYPGTNDRIPELSITGAPSIGTTTEFVIGNPSGAMTAGLMLVSAERAAIPSMLGGRILVVPELMFHFAIPAGGARIRYTVPMDNTLIGMNFLAQVLELDPGARFQVAFSRGLEASLGR